MSDLFGPEMEHLAEVFDLMPLLRRQQELMEAIVICEVLEERCEDTSGKRIPTNAADYLKDLYEDRDSDVYRRCNLYI